MASPRPLRRWRKASGGRKSGMSRWPAWDTSRHCGTEVDRLYSKQEKERIERLKSSGAYLRAYEDVAFMHREDLRPVRLQLELLKPELRLQEEKITSTVVVFGSTRTGEKPDQLNIVGKLEKRLGKK